MSYPAFDISPSRDMYGFDNGGIRNGAINANRRFVMLGQRVDGADPSVHDFCVREETYTSRWHARFDEVWNRLEHRATPNSLWELMLITEDELARVHENPDMEMHDQQLMSILCSWENSLRDLYLAERARGGGPPPVHMVWGHVLTPQKAADFVEIYHSNPKRYENLFSMIVGLKEILHDYALGMPHATDLGVVPGMPDITPVAFARSLICQLSDACFGDWISASITLEREPIDVSSIHNFRIKDTRADGLTLSWTGHFYDNNPMCSVEFLPAYVQSRRYEQHGIERWLHNVATATDAEPGTGHLNESATPTTSVSTANPPPSTIIVEGADADSDSDSDIDISDLDGLTTLELLGTFISTLEDISEAIGEATKPTTTDRASDVASNKSDHYDHDNSDFAPDSLNQIVDQDSEHGLITKVFTAAVPNDDNTEIENKLNLYHLGEHCLVGNIYTSEDSDDVTDNFCLCHWGDEYPDKNGASSVYTLDSLLAPLVAAAYQHEEMLERESHADENSTPLHWLEPDHPDWPRWLSRSDHARWAAQGIFEPPRSTLPITVR